MRGMLRRNEARLNKRRFVALENRSGVEPSGPVSENSKLKFYISKDERKQNTCRITDFEAKSSKDDHLLKLSSLTLILSLFASALISMLIDEIWAGTKVRFLVWSLTLIILNGILFLMVRHNFRHMDDVWTSSIEGFYDDNAWRAMMSIVKCMREFKRFVKWRRFMDVVLYISILGIIAQVAYLLLFLFPQAGWLSNMPLQISNNEVTPVAGFILAQTAWVGLFRILRNYHTDWRDPTLQLCVMVNAHDRSTVPPPTSAGSASNGKKGDVE